MRTLATFALVIAALSADAGSASRTLLALVRPL
jgi:hypothetical protein